MNKHTFILHVTCNKNDFDLLRIIYGAKCTRLTTYPDYDFFKCLLNF